MAQCRTCSGMRIAPHTQIPPKILHIIGKLVSSGGFLVVIRRQCFIKEQDSPAQTCPCTADPNPGSDPTPSPAAFSSPIPGPKYNPERISNPNVVSWLNREAAKAQAPTQTLQGAGKPHRALGTISHQFLHIHCSAPDQRGTRPSLVDGGHCKTYPVPVLCAGRESSRDREDEQPPARARCIPEAGTG